MYVLSYPYMYLCQVLETIYFLTSEYYHITLAIFNEFVAIGLCAWNCYFDDVKSYGANPDNLSEKDQWKTPILLLHGYGGHETNFISLLKVLKNMGNPVYTLTYSPSSRQEELKKAIEDIQVQYKAIGKEKLEIILIGHSLGGIAAVEYTFGKDQLPNVNVKRVITLASRLQITDREIFFKHIIPTLNEFANNFAISSEKKKLFVITAKRDWLLLKEDRELSIFTQEQKNEIEDYSHLSILFAPETIRTLVQLIKMK